MKIKNYIGKKFNRLTAINFVEIKNKQTYWNFICDCGKYKIININKVSRKESPTKSCGCLKKEIWNSVVEKNISKNKNILEQESTIKEYYSKYKSGAKKRGYEFKISINFFKEKIFENCHYCNSTPYRVQKFTKFHTPIICNGIDRKNNKIGYTIENSVSCCIVCNKGKSNFSYDFFVNYINNIKILK